MPILKGLNSEQFKAVTYGDGPLLIVAGAGTGKTTVITQRLIYLIESKKVKLEEVLALTFTEKAAEEMEERVNKFLPDSYFNLWISTFHSFCERILRSHGLDIGLSTDFKLADPTSAWRLIRQNLDRFDLDYYKPLSRPTKFIHALIEHFSRCKDECISPSEYLDYSDKLKMNLDDIPIGLTQESKQIKEIANAYHTYQQLLLENNVLDFGDLINYCLKLFKQRPLILKKYQDQFKYILVDEFQDTNWAQYELIKFLAMPKNNLTVSLDDDQSLYRWRGASVSNVLQFRNDYPQTKEAILINNYRSTQDILDLSYKFIQLNNPNRLEYQLNQIKEISKEAKEKGINLKNFKKFNKKLKADKKGNALIEHLHFKTLEQEARGVVDKIIEILNKDKKISFNNFVILVRANKGADIFLRTLEQSRIPVQFLASKGLYFKPIILDIISYFKLLDNYHESSAVYRVLNLPFFQISAEEIANISRYSYQKGISIYEALNQASLINGLSQKIVLKINWLLDLIKKHTNLTKKTTISEVFISFLEDSGYLKYLTKKSSKGEENLNFINQFYNKIKEFETNQIDCRLGNFIEELKMEIESGEQGSIEFNPELGPEAVKIMTIHSAKGLEFEYVFLVNLVDRKFPTIERKELIEIPKKLIKEILPGGDIHLQEERRLFYVGMTRAKKGLFFTSANDYGGIRKKQLSRFLKEIKMEDCKKKGKTEISYLNLRPKVLQEDCFKTIKNKSKKPQVLPSYFSFTQLETFKNCPLQYKFAHILRIPVKGKNSFSFGKSIHNALFKFVKLATSGEKGVQKDLFNVKEQEERDKKFLQTKDIKKLKIDFKKFLKIYQENWIDEWYENKKQEQEFYKLGKKILKNFYNDFVKIQPEILFIDNQPALEQDFKLKIDKYFLKGKIDRIDKKDKEIEIIDYKTGIPKKKLKPEDKRQMLIYQLALENLLSIKMPKLTYYYLGDGTKLSFEIDEKEKQDFKKKLIIEFEKIKNSDFSPTPGWQCSQCDFKDICEYREN